MTKQRLNLFHFSKNRHRKTTVTRGIFSTLFAGPLMVGQLAMAQMPTPAQIAQFKAMSPAEQQALGVDMNTLGEQPVDTQQSLYDAMNDNTAAAEEGIVDGSQVADEYRKSRNGKIPVFGLDLFQGDPKSFDPAANIVVPSNYVIGPGDNLVVQLYGKENSSLSLTVNREGQVQFPNIGPLSLAGLSFQQVQDLIDTTVAERKVGVKASTTMGALRTIRVFVLGEVERPGAFIVGSLATMTNALFASGGITDVGSLRNVQLKRQGEIITQLDLYDLLLAGDTSNDKRLLPGDVIFVPPVGNNVTITGGVNRPARYELKDSNNLGAAVKIAGGLKNTSHAAEVAVTRVNAIGERSLFNVDLTTREGKSFKLESGDQVAVGNALDFINNQVTIRGNAKRPGPYSWQPELRFSDIIGNPFDVMPGTDLNVALLQTMSPVTGLVEIYIFSPIAAWTAPKSLADPKLEAYDEIYIFDQNSDRSTLLTPVLEILRQQARFNEREQTVFASGSLKFPGEYPRSPNMTVDQLIALAGSLKESAFGSAAEITRYSVSETLERVVSHLAVDLQSSSTVGIEAGDTLNIKQIPLWSERETVNLRGEVMFPGEYAIKPGETLSQVLERAGGLTPHAHSVGAIFSREELRELEQQRLDEFQNQLEQSLAADAAKARATGKEVSQAQIQAFAKQVSSTKAVGRMVIDLPQVIAQPDDYDFAVEDGDSLFVPRYKPSVTVVGEVQYPTSHFYDKKLTAKNYIQRSGGTKEHADTGRIYVVKANGLVVEPSRSKWFRAQSARIEPGDTIVVPLDTTMVNSLEIWSSTTQILYQAAIGAAALTSL